MKLTQDMTLNQLLESKAMNYFNYSRNKIGIQTKQLNECYLEVTSDYDTPSLDQFNEWRRKQANKMMDDWAIVVWGDGSYDQERICSNCHVACQDPIHKEHYREIGKDIMETKEEDEYNSFLDTGYEDVRQEDLQ